MVSVNKGNNSFLCGLELQQQATASVHSYQAMGSAGSSRKPGLSVFWSGPFEDGRGLWLEVMGGFSFRSCCFERGGEAEKHDPGE